MKRRLRAFWLSVVFALSVVVPVKPAVAVVPLVGLAVAAVSNTGAVVTADILTAGVTALIGGSIAALALTPNNADAPMRVPLASDKATIDAAMPPPAAPVTAAPVVQTPAARCGEVLQQLGTAGNVNGCPVATTYNGNGQSWYSGGYYGCGYNRVVTSSACPELNRTYSNDGTYSFYQAQPNSSCGAGYVLNAGNCVLQNARAAVPDGKADLLRSPSGYSVDPDEADSLPAYARVSGGKVYAQGKNSAGQPVMIEYSVSGDGSKTYITHYTQTEDASQTVVKSQSITVDASGSVTNAGASSAVGSISPSAGASSVPTVSTGAAVTSGAGASSQPIVFPTDYARQGEAALAASGVMAKLDTVKSSVDSLKDAPTVENPVVNTPTLSGAQDTFYGADNKIIGLLGWQVPGFTGVCPTADINFDWKEFSYHGRLESHCAYADQFRATAAVMFDALWVVVAFFIVLGA